MPNCVCWQDWVKWLQKSDVTFLMTHIYFKLLSNGAKLWDCIFSWLQKKLFLIVKQVFFIWKVTQNSYFYCKGLFAGYSKNLFYNSTLEKKYVIHSIKDYIENLFISLNVFSSRVFIYFLLYMNPSAPPTYEEAVGKCQSDQAIVSQNDLNRSQQQQASIGWNPQAFAVPYSSGYSYTSSEPYPGPQPTIYTVPEVSNAPQGSGFIPSSYASSSMPPSEMVAARRKFGFTWKMHGDRKFNLLTLESS